MNDDKKMYVPSHPLPGPRSGALREFDPGTRTLKAGFKIAPQFLSLPVDIVFEKDVAVKLHDGVTIYVDVFRPAGAEKVPVISSKNLLGTLMPAIEEYVGANSGLHVIHTGGAHPSTCSFPFRSVSRLRHGTLANLKLSPSTPLLGRTESKKSDPGPPFLIPQSVAEQLPG